MTLRGNHPRESIWSVRQEDRPRFSYYFTILFIIGTTWVVWYQIDYVLHDGVVETIMAIFLGVIQAGVAAVTITFFRFEGADSVGIALDIWRERRRRERETMVAEAVEKAVAEVVAEMEAKFAGISAENEALKRRIAEIEKSNGNTSR